MVYLLLRFYPAFLSKLDLIIISFLLIQNKLSNEWSTILVVQLFLWELKNNCLKNWRKRNLCLFRARNLRRFRFSTENRNSQAHTDPEQRIGFFECLRGSEDILVISECEKSLRKRIWSVSNSTFLEIHKNIFEKNLYRDSQNTKLPQLYCSSWDHLFIKLYWLQALSKPGTYLKLIKDHFSHTGCHKN